jgi:hypothetical protein
MPAAPGPAAAEVAGGWMLLRMQARDPQKGDQQQENELKLCVFYEIIVSQKGRVMSFWVPTYSFGQQPDLGTRSSRRSKSRDGNHGTHGNSMSTSTGSSSSICSGLLVGP